MLESLIGRRYETLESLKNDIELLSEKKVVAIIESETDRLEGTDYMIDYEFEESEVFTLFYLKDNANKYYITEV